MVYVNRKKKNSGTILQPSSLKVSSALIKETQDRAAELGRIISNRDVAISETAKVRDEKFVLDNDIQNRQSIVRDLDREISSKKSLMSDMNRSNETIVFEHIDNVTKLKFMIADLESVISENEKKVKEHSDLSSSLKILNKQFIFITKNRDSIIENSNTLSALFDKREVDLDARESDINDKIKKDGIIRTQTERNLRTIEHYVKRLQRYYDDAGLNINILPVFGIKKDNNPSN